MGEGGWWVSTHLPLLIVVDFSNPLTYLSAGLKKIFKYLLLLKRLIFLIQRGAIRKGNKKGKQEKKFTIIFCRVP